MSVSISGNVSQISMGNDGVGHVKTVNLREGQMDEQPLKSNNAVKLSISQEGMESCRKELYKNGRKTADEITVEKHAFMQQARNVVFINQPESELFQKVSELKALREGSGIYRLSDRAEDYVKAYGNLYDEIVQGYENGTRERYVEDACSETGFRQLTMEEELDSLDKAYQKAAETENSLAENARKAASAFKQTAEKLSQYKGVKTSFADAYKKLEEQGIVSQENTGQKMAALAQAWKDTYQVSGSKEAGMEKVLAMLKDMFPVGSEA
ncbi:MAG: hypothetical protein NC211_07875 [Alistipes senegalensis]|nr:hypothetical protein [Oxalobacter formigenes]MCM1281723.1 hypothetical protein [Alistipes senegalensis]